MPYRSSGVKADCTILLQQLYGGRLSYNSGTGSAYILVQHTCTTGGMVVVWYHTTTPCIANSKISSQFTVTTISAAADGDFVVIYY
jgi:hypothetical protein